MGVPAGAAYVLALFALVQRPLSWLASAHPGYARRALMIAALPFAIPLLWLLWHRLKVAAGFGGALVVSTSLLAATLAVVPGTILAVALIGITPNTAWAVSGGIAFGYLAWVAYDALTDE